METASDRSAISEKKSREQGFVEYVIARCAEDKGFAARMRRADNPATEYQSWEYLASFGVNLENEYERVPFLVIGAAIARAKVERNGSLSLGRAMVACYENGRESEPAKARLRRLLACSDVKEACRVIRPILALISSKIAQPVDYARILRQLRFFGERTRTSWAMEFYGQAESSGDVT